MPVFSLTALNVSFSAPLVCLLVAAPSSAALSDARSQQRPFLHVSVSGTMAPFLSFCRLPPASRVSSPEATRVE